MTKIKTSELTGAALDWAVAKCEGHDPFYASGYIQLKRWIPSKAFTPSTDWAQGGPIIDREKIWLEPSSGTSYAHKDGLLFSAGSTPLIAAMRCYVASKLGDEVDVPEELV